MKNAGTLSWSEVDSREAALIRRCTAGDQTACAELVAEHQRMVFTLALNLLRDRDEALDLSQEVFLRVFRTCRASAASRLSAPGSIASSSTRRATGSDGGGGAPLQPGFTGRASAAVRRARIERHGASGSGAGQQGNSGKIWRALDRLPFDQRTALVLREIDGLRYEEIAFSLGVAVGTVKSRLTRARQSLRAELLGLRT